MRWRIVSHAWVKMTTLFYNSSKAGAVVSIGLVRRGRGFLFSIATVINNNIDNRGARAPLIQILPINLNVLYNLKILRVFVSKVATLGAI